MNVILLRSLGAISVLALSASVAAQEADESALDGPSKANAPFVQAVAEPAGSAELRAAIRRISYNPTDADALADAGNASLILGDANAALNFFTRANAIRPNNGRIVSGLAAATVRTENPFEALRLFDDAVRLGVTERSIAADRALAFDLLGNFSRAQQDYKLARSASASDDILIRQAISLSLAGQKAESDAMLVPLLQKNSASAWRARAFMLAARGDFRESSKVTQGFMDPTSAQRMERYLRLMPELTAAQQAAAIHLGHFPASQYVGRDSEQVRRVASALPQVQPNSGENRLIPAGAPLGTKNAKSTPAKSDKKPETRRERREREKEEIKIATASIPESIKLPKTDRSRLGTETARAKVEEAQSAKVISMNTGGLPTPESARPLVTVGIPQRAQTTPVEQPAILPSRNVSTDNQLPPVSQPTPSATQIAPATVVRAPVQSSPASLNQSRQILTPTGTASGAAEISLASATPVVTQPVASVGVMQGPMPSGEPIAAAAVPASTVVTAPVLAQPQPVAAAPAFDLAAIVSSIQIPEDEQKRSVVPVDLKKIKPVVAKTAAVDPALKTPKIDPKSAAKSKAEPASPARFWVQIATGEASALGYYYRKWSKKSADLFKAQSGWTSAWGKTSRLLVGPFADMKAAKKWESDFKKAGGDGFMWKSENGVVVTALKSK